MLIGPWVFRNKRTPQNGGVPFDFPKKQSGQGHEIVPTLGLAKEVGVCKTGMHRSPAIFLFWLAMPASIRLSDQRVKGSKHGWLLSIGILASRKFSNWASQQCGCGSEIGIYPKWNPGKWNQGLKPAVPWWFNFDPYPCQRIVD